MSMELDKATRLAIESQVKEPWQETVKRWFSGLPPFLQVLAGVFILVAVGALVAATFWEANNAGGGFVMLGKGVAAPWVAYAAGFGFTVCYLVFHRFTAEAMRMHPLRSAEVAKPAFAALVFGLLSLGGVFANLVDNASSNKSISEQQTEGRAALLTDVRALRLQVNSFSEVQMRAMVEADKRAMAASLAEAAGWGMSDLDPDGACLADLKPRPRQLCNMVNGPDGLIGSILQGEAALEAHENTKAALTLAEQALNMAPEAERTQFWDTASKVAAEATGQDESEAKSAETFLGLFMLVISVLTLLGTGLGWDAIFEYLERRGAAQKGAT
jgi:hypothetical protein